LNRITEQSISPAAQIADSARVYGNVIIEAGARVFENAVIRGPAYIGANSVVGNNALIHSGCSIGSKCVIGYGSEIKHVVFGRDVWTHRNFVGDSVVADNCSFGAGTITANLLFNENEKIKVNIEGTEIDTGLNKFGVIMAEDCRTGSNSVLMPGKKIGPNSIVGPGVILMEDLAPNKIALLNQNAYQVRDNRLDLSKGSRDQLRQLIDSK
jgi:bifunctional UDP-N-acetylglucosamine pyrophosphorylase/glucosamine-1-phosphate N-acetyltransferase